MKFEVSIDKNCKEPRVIILTDKMTGEVAEIMRRLSEASIGTITGFSHRGAEIIECRDIIRIYSESQKIFIQTAMNKYTVNSRLYELEDELDSSMFVRISNSEIVNTKKIDYMDISLSGTICIFLQGDIKTYASRRYVPKIKKTLGILR